MGLREFYSPAVITDPYGTPRENGTHTGIDFAHGPGEPIPAILPGEVVTVTNDSRYGNYVDIKSGDYTVRYGHMGALSNLAVGEKVLAGQVIGGVGQTGYATGNHLHLEFRKDGGFVDPSSTVQQMTQLPEWAIEEFNNDFDSGGNFFESAVGDIVGGVGDVIGLGGDLFNVFGDVAKYSAQLLKWILTERHWWAILFGAGGILIAGIGFSLYFSKETSAIATLAATKGMSKGASNG